MLQFLGQQDPEEDDSPDVAAPREPLGHHIGDGEPPSQSAVRLDQSTQGSSSEQQKDTALLEQEIQKRRMLEWTKMMMRNKKSSRRSVRS